MDEAGYRVPESNVWLSRRDQIGRMHDGQDSGQRAYEAVCVGCGVRDDCYADSLDTFKFYLARVGWTVVDYPSPEREAQIYTIERCPECSADYPLPDGRNHRWTCWIGGRSPALATYKRRVENAAYNEAVWPPLLPFKPETIESGWPAGFLEHYLKPNAGEERRESG